MTTRTRFAPSPTGFLHVGGARTALFCYLQARRHGGQFILRIEDTDRERSTEESVNAILEGMTWLGLDYDEGPFYQTHRMARYKELIAQLMNEGKAYPCYCSKERLEKLREKQMADGIKPRYDGHCRDLEEAPEGIDPVIRFRTNPEGATVVEDEVQGRVAFDNAELDDLIIARPDGTPTYNFTVVVDDLDMNVTLVIRGDDHLNNTPRQVLIYQAFGARPPRFAHVPMILGPDGSRLSKRHGAVSVIAYRDQGILPEALLNYLVRLGWSFGDEEIFSVDDMVERFDIADVNKGASRFDQDKLLWLNQHYIKSMDAAHVARMASRFFAELDIDPSTGPALESVVIAFRERVKTLVELAEKSAFCYRDFDEFEAGAAKKHLRGVAAEPLERVKDALANLEHWSPEAIDATVKATAQALEINLGKLAQPLRVAVSGSGVSPGIDQTVFLVGRERSVARIDRALAFIEERLAAQSATP